MQGKEDPFAKAAFVVDKFSGETIFKSKFLTLLWVWRPWVCSVASASGPLSFLGCRQICSFYCSIVIWVFVPDSLRRGNPAQVDWANLRIGMIQWADRMTIFPKIGYLKKLRTDPQLR